VVVVREESIEHGTGIRLVPRWLQKQQRNLVHTDTRLSIISILGVLHERLDPVEFNLQSHMAPR